MNSKDNWNLVWKTNCGSRNIEGSLRDRNTEKLIKYTCFHLNISIVHVFFSNFSRVHMFCDEDCSKLVLYKIWGFTSCNMFNNCMK